MISFKFMIILTQSVEVYLEMFEKNPKKCHFAVQINNIIENEAFV